MIPIFKIKLFLINLKNYFNLYLKGEKLKKKTKNNKNLLKKKKKK